MRSRHSGRSAGKRKHEDGSVVRKENSEAPTPHAAATAGPKAARRCLEGGAAGRAHGPSKGPGAGPRLAPQRSSEEPVWLEQSGGGGQRDRARAGRGRGQLALGPAGRGEGGGFYPTGVLGGCEQRRESI